MVKIIILTNHLIKNVLLCSKEIIYCTSGTVETIPETNQHSSINFFHKTAHLLQALDTNQLTERNIDAAQM